MADLRIPVEFQNELELVEVHDQRTDEEILESLTRHVPVGTSEKNVWAYWHAGVEAMPRWSQRNVIDWVRILGPSWTVRVLDTVPDSPNHALKFVPPELLPECFVKGTMTGLYTGQHSADFLRGALLYQYGGVNIDVGCILIRHLDRVCWDILADPTSPYEVAIPLIYDQVTANHFVAARKGNPFIKRWHELFTHVWTGRNNHEGLLENPLFAFALDTQLSDLDGKFDADWKVSPKTLMEYVSQVLCWRRICMLEDAGDGFSGSEYWQHRVFCFDAVQEDWAERTILGPAGSGKVLFDALALPRAAGDTDNPEYATAKELVWRLLTKSTMLKISHGTDITHTVQLGTLWDKAEGKDREHGSFAELLRYGSVHYRQKREEVVKRDALKSEFTMKKGLLEP